MCRDRAYHSLNLISKNRNSLEAIARVGSTLGILPESPTRLRGMEAKRQISKVTTIPCKADTFLTRFEMPDSGIVA